MFTPYVVKMGGVEIGAMWSYGMIKKTVREAEQGAESRAGSTLSNKNYKLPKLESPAEETRRNNRGRTWTAPVGTTSSPRRNRRRMLVGQCEEKPTGK